MVLPNYFKESLVLSSNQSQPCNSGRVCSSWLSMFAPRWFPKLHLISPSQPLPVKKLRYPPPPRKYYENNSPRIFLCNFGGRLRQNLRNYQKINSPRIILRNWRPQRPQTRPCWVTRNLRNSQENISQRIFLRNWLRETVAITPKIIPQEFVCVSNFFEGGGLNISLHPASVNISKITPNSTGRKRWKTNDEKMVDFWCQSFSRFTQSFSRFLRDVNGEKNVSLFDDLFHG